MTQKSDHISWRLATSRPRQLSISSHTLTEEEVRAASSPSRRLCSLAGCHFPGRVMHHGDQYILTSSLELSFQATLIYSELYLFHNIPTTRLLSEQRFHSTVAESFGTTLFASKGRKYVTLISETPTLQIFTSSDKQPCLWPPGDAFFHVILLQLSEEAAFHWTMTNILYIL